jgi:hypothetical protein
MAVAVVVLENTQSQSFHCQVMAVQVAVEMLAWFQQAQLLELLVLQTSAVVEEQELMWAVAHFLVVLVALALLFLDGLLLLEQSALELV